MLRALWSRLVHSRSVLSKPGPGRVHRAPRACVGLDALKSPQRRDFLAGAVGATAAAVLLAPRTAKAGDPSFMNNVPDPLLAGKDLPTFKFALEKSKARVIGTSTVREATVEQLPISKGLAGASLELGPGDMRELHWHGNAAEWAFVNRGRVRTTVIGPNGDVEMNQFEPGDVWYFPRGHGHMLECLGDEPCHFVLIFDNGYAPAFGTFSSTAWVGHTPKALLAKQFGLPESTFDGFPRQEVFFAHSEAPPSMPAPPLGGCQKSPPSTHRYRLLAKPPRVDTKGGKMWLVDSTTFPIAKTITGVILELEPGALRGLHWHPTADEWQYVFEGRVSVTLFGAGGRYRIETLEQGDVGYIPQGCGHSIENVGDKKCRVLIGLNAGVYEDIELTEWMAANPVGVLATNFGKPANLFEKFPRKGGVITGKEGPDN